MRAGPPGRLGRHRSHGGPLPVPTRISTSITARTLLVSALLGALLSASFVLLVVAVNDQRDAGRLALSSQQAITAGARPRKTVNNPPTRPRRLVSTRKAPEPAAPHTRRRPSSPQRRRR